MSNRLSAPASCVRALRWNGFLDRSVPQSLSQSGRKDVAFFGISRFSQCSPAHRVEQFQRRESLQLWTAFVESDSPSKRSMIYIIAAISLLERGIAAKLTGHWNRSLADDDVGEWHEPSFDLSTRLSCGMSSSHQVSASTIATSSQLAAIRSSRLRRGRGTESGRAATGGPAGKEKGTAVRPANQWRVWLATIVVNAEDEGPNVQISVPPLAKVCGSRTITSHCSPAPD